MIAAYPQLAQDLDLDLEPAHTHAEQVANLQRRRAEQLEDLAANTSSGQLSGDLVADVAQLRGEGLTFRRWWSANTGNGYYGAYQFLLSTWRSVGGRGYPHLASPAEQTYRAWLLWRRTRSWSQWGSRRLCGL